MTLTAKAIDWLTARHIDGETADRVGVRSARDKDGGEVIAFPYVIGSEVVNHKFRSLVGKRFWQDSGGRQCFWNFNVITDSTLADEPLVITEGEMDALAAMQAGFPRAVSVPGGAPAAAAGDEDAGAKYAFARDAKAALGACKEIILAVDGDENGKRLGHDLAIRLGRGRCKWLVYPAGCKDLNDVLVKEGEGAVTTLLRSGRWYRVSGLYRMSEIPPRPDKLVRATGFPSLDNFYKIRSGDFVVVTGVPGVGKSVWTQDLVSRFALKHGARICMACFESDPRSDFMRTARQWCEASSDLFERSIDADEFVNEHFVFIVGDNAGNETMSIGWLLDRCAAAVVQYDAEIIVIDPWNEIDHDKPPEMSLTEYTGEAIKEVKRMAQSLDVHVIVVAHPTKLAAPRKGPAIPSLYDISDCYSDDTEVLTRRGWLPHSDIGLSDEVACFDLEKSDLRWARPSRVVRCHHDGEMVRLKGYGFDMLVTPNHRLIVKPAWKRPTDTQAKTSIGRPPRWEQDVWQFVRADALPRAPFKMPHAALLDDGADPATITIGDTEYEAEAFVRFLGWYLAEGWETRTGIGLCQSQGAVMETMRRGLEVLGVAFSEGVQKYPDRPDYLAHFRWYIGIRANRDLVRWMHKNCAGVSHTKAIPRLVFDLCPRLKRVFLEAFIDGDGYRPANREGYKASTTSPFLRDGLQRIAVECGIPCCWHERKWCAKPHHKRSWQLNFGRPERSTVRLDGRRHVSRQDYSGDVWCLTVPTGAYVTRRNGCVHTGLNSAHWANKSDVGIVIYETEGWGMTVISVVKVRFREMVGNPGKAHFKFNPATRRFEEADAPPNG